MKSPQLETFSVTLMGTTRIKQLYRWTTLFGTFLCPPCTTTTWNFLISRFMEKVNTRQRFFFLLVNLDTALQNSYPKKMANIWQIKGVGIRAMKFETARIFTFWVTFLLLLRCRRCLSSFLSHSPPAGVMVDKANQRSEVHYLFTKRKIIIIGTSTFTDKIVSLLATFITSICTRKYWTIIYFPTQSNLP